MIEWLCLFFGAPILALIIKRLIRVPYRPKLLHSPYARPGPWHYLKQITARIWLSWKMVRHPRELNVINTNSKKYENMGLVATELEKMWELPHELENRESLDGMFFYGTDGSGIFFKVSINRQINRQALVSLLFILKDGTTYQLPNAPDTLMTNTDGRKVFSAGGVKFQLLEAMRSWRIIFNGLAKQTSNGKETEVHLRINMIWTAFSRPYEFKREFSRKLLAKGMARELWRGRQEFWRMSEPNFNGVDQWGVMVGTYQVGESINEVYLRGLRQRRWGQSNWSTLHRKLDIIGACEDGNYFYLSATSDSERLTHEVWGHLYHPNGTLYKINACNLDLEKLGESGPVPRHFSIRFSAKRRNFHAIIHLMPMMFDNMTGHPWKHRTCIHPCHLTLNSRLGRVLFLSTSTFHGDCSLETRVSLPYLSSPIRLPYSTEVEKLIVLFTEEACRFDALVGAKGSSLALLTTTVGSSPVACCVPAGFCLTVGAWKAQTRENEELQLLFKELQGSKNLEESCSRASQLLGSSPVIPFIQDCIREALVELFGEEVESKRLAVRSSALGEDGEELSAAGQNATVLGCKGFEAILQGLQDCWASLLSYQSVEYRRQHGEPLIPGMGVVIQEMVDAEAAGVLFTVNPMNGDPSRMILTANYGLGESVVSAAVDPDTIYLKRTSTGDVSVAEKILGRKQSKIVLLDDETKEEKIPEHESESFCVSDELAIRIGQLGVYLEKGFGGPRDLEFAVAGGVLYLLQARPVTALDAWTDYEIRHEFDTPILTDSDYLTKANVGEVIPGAMTPLTLSVTGRMLELTFQSVIRKSFGRSFEVNPWYIGRFDALQQNHLFLNVIDAFLRDIEAELSDNNRAIDMAVFGHIVTTPAMHRLALQRFGVAGLRLKYRRYRSVFLDLFFNHKRVEKASAKFSDFSFSSLDMYTDPAKLYEAICFRLPALTEIGRVHTQVSKASAMTQLIAFLLMLDGRKEWTPELYGEMAQLFGSISNVESADVPVALRELAKVIQEENGAEFIQKSTEDASDWLLGSVGKAGDLFRIFLKRHGHRSIKEMDLATETWHLNPHSLVAVLQSMISNPESLEDDKKEGRIDPDEWLKMSVSSWKIGALKFFVPRCRSAVCYREKTKSLLIRTIHCFRLAYRRLAELLVAEGRIPDSGLVFFFTQGELKDLIGSRGAAALLIGKAVRRRNIQLELDSLVFPELSLGIPKPIFQGINAIPEESAGSGSMELRGTPVFRGRIKARACVALNLQEAKGIRCGDILITRSTDIGWSPYFPLLSGVVTELGGLISHGAVVAREYGLPAIVGCQKVTQIFHTGDTVVLDGAKGTISRLESVD